MIHVGVIGYRNHALRLIEIANEHKLCNVKYIYHPSKNLGSNLSSTNDIKDLFSCDIVVIASPSNTHYEYIIKIIKNSKAFIFCEKPPVTKKSNLKALNNLSDEEKSRIYFNFNMRFSFLSDILQDKSILKHIGQIHNIEIINSHGLAFKQEYDKSWRADGKENLHAITETVAIHYIDILQFIFGDIVDYSYYPSITAKTGTAYDSALINLKFDSTTASIYTSYASPLINEITILGTNGYIKIENNKLSVFSPRDTFTKEGFFVKPPIVIDKNIVTNNYKESLTRSFDFFIDNIRKKSLPLKYYDASVASNKFILDMV